MSPRILFSSYGKTGILAFWLVVTACPSINALAAGFVLTGEIAFGGDDLAVVSGDSGDLQAGQLLTLGVGYDFDLNSQKTLLLRTGINYKFDSVDASNGEADFDRWPLDVLVISRQDSWALGAGITYHLSPTFEATINGVTSRVDFDDSPGFLLQAGYRMTPTMELGARLTLIEYEPSQPTVMFPSLTPVDKVDGDSIGIYVTVGF